MTLISGNNTLEFSYKILEVLRLRIFYPKVFKDALKRLEACYYPIFKSDFGCFHPVHIPFLVYFTTQLQKYNI